MAREDCSERELPSAEVRRQILQNAGMVLDQARDLLARLDHHEVAFPRSIREHQEVLERTPLNKCAWALSRTPSPDQALAA